jgi:hypothetical protein
MERTRMRVEMDLNGCFGSMKLPRRNLKFEVLINTERERGAGVSNESSE